MHAENFFVPSFLEAIKEKTEESFRRIMDEPSSGIYTFEMLQPSFCQMLVSEVSHLFPFLIMHISLYPFYICLLCLLMKFWLLRWIILKDGAMRPNSESCDLIQWINMVLFLMTLAWKKCLTDWWMNSYGLYLEVIFIYLNENGGDT